MPTLTAAEIVAATGGRVIQGDPATRFADFHFDSRQVGPGTLFFALATTAGDGHAYLADVARRGGGGAVVNQDAARPELELPLIAVADTTRAYRDLALWVRQRWDRVRYVGITGSVGKTTTREFAGHILRHASRTYSAPGNWNNWLGVPFALLKMPDDAEVAVLELAMSDPGIGEVDHLAALVRPNVACVLNAFPVHLEFLGTVDNVARAKLEITNHLTAADVALVNGDSEHLRRHHRPTPGRHLWFGRGADNDAVLTAVVERADGVELTLDLAGRQERLVAPPLTAAQVENLFAAVLVARELGMELDSIRAAVASLSPVTGRGTLHRFGSVRVVDDTYNANPVAARTLLEWARAAHPDDPLIAVLGDMLELGADAPRFHHELGRVAAGCHLAALVAVGPLSRHTADGAVAAGMDAARVSHVASADDAGAVVVELARPGAVVVFKGSRGMRLERAVAALRQALTG